MKQKPTELHVLSGTSRTRNTKQQHAALTALDRAPSAPEWLKGADAREHWDRVLGFLVARRVVTELDLGPFAVMCHLYGQIVDQAKSGGAMRGPLVGKYMALCNEFGLTPASAHKVRPIAAPVPESSFGSFREQRP